MSLPGFAANATLFSEPKLVIFRSKQKKTKESFFINEDKIEERVMFMRMKKNFMLMTYGVWVGWPAIR